MPTFEDEELARIAVKPHIESDEKVRLDIERVADLEWEENPAPDREKMTGQWRLTFRDGSEEEIDLPKANVDGAIDEARKLIAKKLTAL